MAGKIYNVLFLCTGNSARSIMAEKLMEHWGKGKFKTYSAGSFPNGEVNPFAIKVLIELKITTEGLRSKSWDEFTGQDAPHFDFIFTVCDNAAGEVCPFWAGQPMTAHWGLKDPAAVEGSDDEKLAAFKTIAKYLSQRVMMFISIPFDNLDNIEIKKEIDAIGKTVDNTK